MIPYSESRYALATPVKMCKSTNPTSFNKGLLLKCEHFRMFSL